MDEAKKQRHAVMNPGRAVWFVLRSTQIPQTGQEYGYGYQEFNPIAANLNDVQYGQGQCQGMPDGKGGDEK